MCQRSRNPPPRLDRKDEVVDVVVRRHEDVVVVRRHVDDGDVVDVDVRYDVAIVEQQQQHQPRAPPDDDYSKDCCCCFCRC